MLSLPLDQIFQYLENLGSQPSLALVAVRSGVLTVDPGFSVRLGTVEFEQDISAPDDSGGPRFTVYLKLNVYRPERQLRKMDGPVAGRAVVAAESQVSLYHYMQRQPTNQLG